jgi:hypothetical protein
LQEALLLISRPVRSASIGCALVVSSAIAIAQPAPEQAYYSRNNSYGLFVGYANNSIDFLEGDAAQRKLLLIGASYSRRLLLNHSLNWQYDVEILPVALNSDPVETITTTESFTNPPKTITSTSQTVPEFACNAGTVTTSIPGGTSTTVTTCSRRWVFGGGISPVGFRWNFRPHHTLQPLLVGHGGFIESVDAIPIRDAASFNFTFDIGGGLEWYRTPAHSLRFEFRLHHISNKETAPRNPGIESPLFQFSWAFGR